MKILITGGTGLLGQALVATSGGEHQLCVLHRRSFPVGGVGVEPVVLDILDHEALASLFESCAFDAVIHMAGMANVDEVERRSEDAWRSNVLGTQYVAEIARKKDIRLVYVSSNAVFDGEAAPYAETAPTNPINRYGKIKVECETLVARMCPDAVIVRPILMYGWHAPEGRANPVTWLLARLGAGESTHLVTDVHENPLWSHHCAEAIWRILRLGKNGTFHIAGKDVMNRYEFGRLIAQVFGLDGSLLHPVQSSFFPAIAPRPRNTSFLTRRMQDELGMEPLSVREGLERMLASSPRTGLKKPS
jgi:dTDP-4-dehydrorhamnose reductase